MKYDYIDRRIDDFFNSTLEDEIVEYFGYQKGWHPVSLEDSRYLYWCIYKGQIYFGEDKFTDLDNPTFSAEIIGSVIRKGKYALIPVDTNCDDNKYLSIFLLDKEIKL